MSFECAGCCFDSFNDSWFWSYVLGIALPAKDVFFVVSVIRLHFGSWMILMVIFP